MAKKRGIDVLAPPWWDQMRNPITGYIVNPKVDRFRTSKPLESEPTFTHSLNNLINPRD
jgi:hypothetical protein